MSLGVKVIDFISNVSKIASTHKHLLMTSPRVCSPETEAWQNLVSGPVLLGSPSPPYLCSLAAGLRDNTGTPTEQQCLL